MNNSFSLARFGAYTKAEAHIHLKKALSLAGLYILFIAVFYTFLATQGQTLDKESVISQSTMIGLFGALLITSGAFKVFKKTGGGTFAMQMPVATCEKFTLRVITHLIILPAFIILTPCMVWDVVDYLYNIKTVIPSDTYSFFWPVWAQIMVFQATFFYGAVLFRKANFLKMAGCWIIAFMLFQSLVRIGPTDHGFNEYALEFFSFMNNYGYYVSGVLTLGFVVLAWLRFRKLQILK